MRALIVKYPQKDREGNLHEPSIEGGLSIKVEIDTLIENIFVAPNSPSWFVNLIKTVLKRYDCDFNVVQSEMENNPLF